MHFEITSKWHARGLFSVILDITSQISPASEFDSTITTFDQKMI
jgi:hypothetical protein